MKILRQYKYDLILILSILLIAVVLLVLFSFSQNGLSATIYNYETAIDTLSLNQDCTKNYTINGYEYTVCVQDYSIYVESCTCKDKTCKKMGHISKLNQSIICIPSGLKISINGNENYDAITY